MNFREKQQELINELLEEMIRGNGHDSSTQRKIFHEIICNQVRELIDPPLETLE